MSPDPACYLFQGSGEKNLNRKIGTLIHIWIHFGPGSGSTIPKGGSEDPVRDPLFRKGRSEGPDPRQNEMDPQRWFSQ